LDGNAQRDLKSCNTPHASTIVGPLSGQEAMPPDLRNDGSMVKVTQDKLKGPLGAGGHAAGLLPVETFKGIWPTCSTPLCSNANP